MSHSDLQPLRTPPLDPTASDSEIMEGVDLDGRHPPIPLPPRPSRQRRRYLRRSLGAWLDRHENFQWHEKAWELEDDDPWAALEFLRLIVERQPEYWRHHLHLADAWLRVGEIEAALDASRTAHDLVPECTETHQLVIECLDRLGRDRRSFAWKSQIDVLELDERTTNLCFELLAPSSTGRRAWLDSSELWFELTEGRACLFDDEELAKHLSADARFVIHRFDHELVVGRVAP